jgi:hypothetical protein
MAHPKEETGNGHTVTVVTTFAVSGAKAREVLERWWVFKDERKKYMRLRRAGRMKKAVGA